MKILRFNEEYKGPWIDGEAELYFRFLHIIYTETADMAAEVEDEKTIDICVENTTEKLIDHLINELPDDILNELILKRNAKKYNL